MSYNKRTWATGNVVGAVDLNRMEQGIEDASGGGAEPLIVNFDHVDGDGNSIYDKTWQQVHDAMPNVLVKCHTEDTDPDTSDVYVNDWSSVMVNVTSFTVNGATEYGALAFGSDGQTRFRAVSAQDLLMVEGQI